MPRNAGRRIVDSAPESSFRHSLGRDKLAWAVVATDTASATGDRENGAIGLYSAPRRESGDDRADHHTMICIKSVAVYPEKWGFLHKPVLFQNEDSRPTVL
jgi:hypothetical protein